MYHSIHLTTTIPSVSNSISRSLGRRGFLLIALALALAEFALSPQARACNEGCDTSNDNTFLGDFALAFNTSGSENTAIGYSALLTNTTGSENTATGSNALTFNTTGSDNTANGRSALQNNTTGNTNTANGSFALRQNTTGHDNMANGYSALTTNTTGSNNTANGVNALSSNTTGNFNAVNGTGALKANTIGSNNAAEGYRALYTNTTGGSNTALGSNALMKNTTGSSNIAVGISAGSNLTTGSNNIDIGGLGVAGESSTMRLGKNGTQTTTFIAGISGATVAGGVGVIVDSTGHLGTITSSVRFKDDVQPMDKASEAVLSLKPVTFRYKHDLDPAGIPQFGLVAEEVEKVDPDLVARDEQGKPYTVRYEAVNAMLLNEFLKEHREVERLEATMGELLQKNAAVAELKAQIKALNARLDKQAATPRRVTALAPSSTNASRLSMNTP
jgi:hypothetical protein